MSLDSSSAQQASTQHSEELLELSPSSKFLVVLIICVFALVLASSLTITDFWSNHEGRVVGVARNMLHSGDWWVPILNGVPRMEKSPLVYWVVATSGALWDQVSEFSARLPSLMVGTGCVVLTILIGRTILTNTAALLGGLFQIATLVYWRDCRTAELDIYLIFFICLAMFAFCQWHFAHRRRSGWILLFWIALGCGGACKNVLTVLPTLITCALAFWLCKPKLNEARQPDYHTDVDGQPKRFWPWHLIGITAFVLLTLAWNVSMYFQIGQHARAVWQNEINTVLLQARSARPAYYYLLTIFTWAFPASVFVPGIFAVAFLKGSKKHSKQLLFLFLWIAVLLVAYSVWPNSKKKIEYIQPMLPAFVLLLGYIWNQLLTRDFRHRLNKGDMWQLSCHGLLILLCGLTAIGFSVLDSEGRWIVAVFGAGLVVLGLSGLLIRNNRVSILLWGTALASLALMVINFTWFVPLLNRQMSPRLFAQTVARHGGKPSKVAIYRPSTINQSPGIRKLQGFPPLNFYLGYDLPYLTSPAELAKFMRNEPSGLVITTIGNLDLERLGLKLLHRQDMSRPRVDLTVKRLPQGWQELLEPKVQNIQRPAKYTLLLGKDR